jgi:hypothetical protein
MLYPAHMAKTSAVIEQPHLIGAAIFGAAINAAQNWLAISSTIPSAKSTPSAASFRSDWTNKRSYKGFYTFTTDRTPGGYID